MSAVSNITIVAIADRNQAIENPVGDNILTFANYDEAMSWSKWLLQFQAAGTRIRVWNYNGNSGYWEYVGGVPSFYVIPNTNWP
jgi:hypothetical protein